MVKYHNRKQSIFMSTLGQINIRVMMSTVIVQLYYNMRAMMHFEMDKQRRMRLIKYENRFKYYLLNRTIPLSIEGENDPKFRRTESLTSQLYCRVRSRNTNLFTADQVIEQQKYRQI